MKREFTTLSVLIILMLSIALSNRFLARSGYVQVSQGGPTEVCGYISKNTTWTLANTPYIVTCDVTVLNSSTLTIEPGVTVKFIDKKSLVITSGCSLIARGTTTHNIIFTSNKTGPKAGDWGNVWFLGKNLVMSYALIEYATTGVKLETTVGISNSTISNCNVGVEGKLSNAYNLTVTDNTGDGLSLSSSLRIEDSNVSSNGGHGITITATIDMDNCIVSNNTEDGVILSNGGDIQNSRIIGNGRNGGNGTCILGPTTIKNATISDNGGDGIWAESSMLIIECNISGNERNGIKSNYVTGTTTIKDSTISSNGDDGIWMASSMSITGCDITENAGNGTSGHLLVDEFSFSILNCNISSNDQNGVTAPRTSTSGYIHMRIKESIITYNNMSGLSGRGYVLNSTVSGNNGTGILGNYTIEYYNVITRNKRGGFNGTGRIYWSSILNNTPYDAIADVWPNNITATYNWWGTNNSAKIEEHIWHWHDDKSLGYVDYDHWLPGPPPPIDPYPPEISVPIWKGTSPDPYIAWINFEKDYPNMTRTNEPVRVSVNVTDNDSPMPSGVDNVLLSYRVDGGEWWNTTMMYNETSGNWTAIIPAQGRYYDPEKPPQKLNSTVEFFIQAYDKAGNKNSTSIYSYTVMWLVIGDINGDNKVRIDDVLAVALRFGEPRS